MHAAVSLLFEIYTIMLFVRILSSWLPELAHSRAIQFIAFYTDPYLNLFRQIIPPLGMIDISPIFAFFGLQLMRSVLLFIIT